MCASSDVTLITPSSPLLASNPTSTSNSFPPTPAQDHDPAPKTLPLGHQCQHTLTPITKSGIGSGLALSTPTPRKLSGLFGSPLFLPSVAVASKGKLGISPIRVLLLGKDGMGMRD